MTQKALWLPVLRSHRAFLLQCSGKQSGQFFQPTDGLVQLLLRRMTESVKVLVRLDSGCMVRLSLDIRFLIIEDVLGIQGVFDLVHGR